MTSTVGGAAAARAGRLNKLLDGFGLPDKMVKRLKTILSDKGSSLDELYEIGTTGCFVAGTLVWVNSPVPAEVAIWSGYDDAFASWNDEPENQRPAGLARIEDVELGQRIPSSANSRRSNHESATDYSQWQVVHLEVAHVSGAVVDAWLLRSPEWLSRNGLQVGATVNLRLTEIETRASGFVHSIVAGPEVLPGDGDVVISRFVTRQASDLVSVTFSDGTQLTGTSGHPVWSPLEQTWRGLGELHPGSFVQTRDGLLEVLATELTAPPQPIYNIEVEDSHQYEVTAAGILVHNTDLKCQRLLDLRNNPNRTTLENAELADLEAELTAPKGLVSREGIAYELKHLNKHLPGTSESARLIRKDGSAHVFKDKATLSKVEQELLENGESLGTVRGWERYGKHFDEPIGYRIDAQGNKIPLHYGELKLNPKTGLYHIIPRTGPAS